MWLRCVRSPTQEGPSAHIVDLARVQGKANTSCKSISDVIHCLLVAPKGPSESERLVSRLVSRLSRTRRGVGGRSFRGVRGTRPVLRSYKSILNG